MNKLPAEKRAHIVGFIRATLPGGIAARFSLVAAAMLALTCGDRGNASDALDIPPKAQPASGLSGKVIAGYQG